MLDALAIIAQLLGLMAALIVIGEPLRLLFSKIAGFFENINFIEICVLNVYLGGLILYVLALPPLHLFSVPIIFSLLLVSSVISSVYYWRLKRPSQILARHMEGSQGRSRVLEYSFVFGMFLIALCVQVIPLTSLIYGSIHDVSLHSLMAEVILEDKYIPYTLEPYLPEGIIYPQASYVIFAFAASLIRWVTPQAVTYGTSLFSALSVLGAYFLARRIWLNRGFYLGLVFIFAFVTAWPVYVTWGANPFVVGFTLFLICLGLLFTLLSARNTNDKKELVIVGILFGYLGAIMISFLQSLLVIMVLWLLFNWFRKSANTKRLFKDCVILFLVSCLSLSPSLFRFVYYYQFPGHNIGLPSDFMGYPRSQSWFMRSFQWIFANLSPYVFLRIEIICILILSVILIFKVGKGSELRRVYGVSLLIFASSLVLSVISSLLPSEMNVVSWGHQGIILSVAICLLLSTFNSNLFIFFSRVTFKLRIQNFKKKSNAVLITILVLSAVYVPFVYARLALDSFTLKGSYGMFAVTSRDDDKLMLWIKDNLTEDAVILVNPYEPGLFIPAISHRKAVFITPGSQLSRSYQELVGLLRNDTLNVTSYSIIEHFNITHVYVGSGATYWWIQNYKWKPQLFLGNPNFPLVKRIGNAYLFNFSYNNLYIVFLDDFEHNSWHDYGWQTYFEGNGLGNVTITNNFGCDDSKCLRISTRAVYTVPERNYINWVRREIFVMNNSQVRLSFYLNATEGFHGKDTFAVFISNIYHNQSIVITTPNGIHEDYNYTIPLDGFEGSFNCSLSMMWHEMFNSSLPNPFILEFANYDFDGIKNVAYIDDIKVTSTPNN